MTLNEYVLIDIGTSTTKVYTYSQKKLFHVKNQTIFLSEGFTSQNGITTENFKKICIIINEAKKNYAGKEVLVFATAIFRKFSDSALEKFKKEFKTETGLDFKVLSHNEENLILEEALIDKIPTKVTLLINIGGGSTELVIMKDKKTIKRENINLGVGSIIKRFPELVAETTLLRPSEIINFANDQLPLFENKTEIAFYTGGELKYMQAAKYPLTENKLFEDDKHPQIISFEEFSKKNKEIFETKMSELKKFMPENPEWMTGSRACSALAETICAKCGIKIIVPSNLNLIDGLTKRLEKKN